MKSAGDRTLNVFTFIFCLGKLVTLFGSWNSGAVTMLVVGPAGVGTGEGMGGPGDTATLLAEVMGTELELLFLSDWKVHMLEGLGAFLPRIPLLSLKRYDPLSDGFRSKEVVSRAIRGISDSWCCWQQQ